jgi:hypothetical protein
MTHTLGCIALWLAGIALLSFACLALNSQTASAQTPTALTACDNTCLNPCDPTDCYNPEECANYAKCQVCCQKTGGSELWCRVNICTPDPQGGIAELPLLAGASADEAGVPTEGSGWSVGSYAALVGGLAAAAVVLSAGAWYARRRWLS